jgi:hypothetical protein
MSQDHPPQTADTLRQNRQTEKIKSSISCSPRD